MSESKPGSSRRTVLKGAAWTAPVIVLATAAPAAALSGPASVTQRVSGTVDQATLDMRTTVGFENANTGATAATVLVTVRSTFGNVGATNPTDVSPGWLLTASTPNGSAAIRYFTFQGQIAGAPNASSIQPSVLAFTVKVERAVAELAAGTIEVDTTVTAPAVVTPNPVRGTWGPVPPPPS